MNHPPRVATRRPRASRILTRARPGRYSVDRGGDLVDFDTDETE